MYNMKSLQTTIYPCRGTSKVAAGALLVLSTVLLLAVSARTEAAVINAADASLSAVQAAINSASSGDTVQVPAGTATWTSGITINNDISLIGAGEGQTILIDELSSHSSGSACMMYWPTTTSNNVCRLSGFTFQGGVTNTTLAGNATVMLFGYCNQVRIDHCQFLNMYNTSLWLAYANFGVVDHCQFYSSNPVLGVHIQNGMMGGDPSDWGDVSWAEPVLWGQTNDFVYIEDCQFWYGGPGAVFAVNDMARGSKVVFRNNMVTNDFFQMHGTENRLRGGHAFEIYGNTFVHNNVYAGYNVAIDLRSGTGIVFSNTFVGYGGMFSFEELRESDQLTDGHTGFGVANGQGNWDSNSAVLFTGTHTGTNGSYFLVDSNQNWTPGQFVGGYELQNVTLGATNTGTFGLIITNTATTIYCEIPDAGPQVQMLWTNGQNYAIYQVVHAIDQVGSSNGDLIVDTAYGSSIPSNTVTHTAAPNMAWPHQPREPVFQWANTWNGTPNYVVGAYWSFYDSGSWAAGLHSGIILNRDFTNGVKPNYTPLVYPYPLVSGSPAAPTYALTVLNGTGSGNYSSGSIVSISANTNTIINAITIKGFANWSGLYIANTNSANTTVTIPATNLTVKANYILTPVNFSPAINAPAGVTATKGPGS